MPSYEMMIILRAFEKPQLHQSLKRITKTLMGRGALIESMDNLGTRTLPYKMSKHGERFTTGSYFMINFHSPPTIIDDLKEELHREVDLIRPRLLRKEEPFDRPCEKGPCAWGELTNPKHEKIYQVRKGFRKY